MRHVGDGNVTINEEWTRAEMLCPLKSRSFGVFHHIGNLHNGAEVGAMKWVRSGCIVLCHLVSLPN